MCVIIHLQPGYTPPYKYIETASHNNPHGFGLVIKRPGEKLEIIRELNPEGNNPERIYKLLKDNENAERFLHVRWRTAGDVSMDNVQPFRVFEDEETGREIVFMHNGTMYSSSNHGNVATRIVGQDGDSDSKKFAQTVLTKLLKSLVGEKGLGDIEDGLIQTILDKFWSGNNRGMLVCNDLDPYYFNLTSWKTIKTTEEAGGKTLVGQFMASNDDYFDRVKRGPLFEKLEQERKKAAEEEAARREAEDERLPTTGTVANSPLFRTRHSLSCNFAGLLEDIDFYTPEGYCSIANMTYAETRDMLVKMDDDDKTALVMYLSWFLKENTQALVENVNELEKAKLIIESVPQEIIELRRTIAN